MTPDYAFFIQKRESYRMTTFLIIVGTAAYVLCSISAAFVNYRTERLVDEFLGPEEDEFGVGFVISTLLYFLFTVLGPLGLLLAFFRRSMAESLLEEYGFYDR